MTSRKRNEVLFRQRWPGHRMSVMDFALRWDVNGFTLCWGVCVLFAFLGLTPGVTVRRRIVQRAPFRCSRSFLLAVCAVTLDTFEFVAVVAPHLLVLVSGWFVTATPLPAILLTLPGLESRSMYRFLIMDGMSSMLKFGLWTLVVFTNS